jgi:hypothetical protein
MAGHKDVHFVREEAEQYQHLAYPDNVEAPVEFEKPIEADGNIKKVPLDRRVPHKAAYLGTETTLEEHT